MTYDWYLVTGATGYLGSAVVKRLLADGRRVRALVMPGDALAGGLPKDVEVVTGRVDQPDTLHAFFEGTGRGTCVVHCAGIVSIASRASDALWAVNVEGTRHITELCARRGVSKLVYISSVHAIPERPHGETIRECGAFDPDDVVGAYAKSKSAATVIVLKAAADGLNASVVHPSGVIGPYDRGGGSVTGAILAYCNGRLRVSLSGGFDFVDVRDVADGIAACCERGNQGECYILSGRYAGVTEILSTVRNLTDGRRILFTVPLKLIKIFAPLCERASLRARTPLFLTPYSVYTMGTNAMFSHEKATRELGYAPRDLRRTLCDMVAWLREEGRVKPRGGLKRRQKASAHGV